MTYNSSKSIYRDVLEANINALLDALVAEEKLTAVENKLLEMEKEIKYQNDNLKILENQIADIKKGDRRQSQRRQQDLGPPPGEKERRSGSDRRQFLHPEPQYPDKIKA